MLTLSYGYLKPENGDLGSAWFPALAGDIVQLNNHTHDGIGSAILTAQSIVGISDTILAANWVATSGGTYRQAVTTPANVSFSSYGKSFEIANGASIGHVIYPSVEKISATQYYVYTNDNTLNLTVLYLV